MLDYYNTNIEEIGLSPAQMFLGRRLKTDQQRHPQMTSRCAWRPGRVDRSLTSIGTQAKNFDHLDQVKTKFYKMEKTEYPEM